MEFQIASYTELYVLYVEDDWGWAMEHVPNSVSVIFFISSFICLYVLIISFGAWRGVGKWKKWLDGRCRRRKFWTHFNRLKVAMEQVLGWTAIVTAFILPPGSGSALILTPETWDKKCHNVTCLLQQPIKVIFKEIHYFCLCDPHWGKDLDSDQNPKQINTCQTENFNAKGGGGGIWLTRVNADALEKSAYPTWPAV